MSLITITQFLGAGDPGIPRQVADALGIEFFDNDRLKQKARDIGVHTDDLAKLDEKVPGFFNRFFSTRPDAYLSYMEAVVYEVSRIGEGVIFGHGSPIMLQSFDCALHVFIHASLDRRIQNLMARQSIERKIAEKVIRKNDNDKRGFYRYAFNLDWNAPSIYDLFINTDKIGSATAVKLITAAAQSDEAKACSITASEDMTRLSMERKLRAKMSENNINLANISLTVPENNVVSVIGFTFSERDKNRLLEILNADPAISEVRAQVTLMQQHAGE